MTAALQYFTVRATYETVAPGTAASSGIQPVVTPITGTVTFTPNVQESDSAALDTTIALQPITALINASGVLCASDGIADVELVDNVNLNLGDTRLLYLVEYSGISDALQLNSFWFAAPGDGSTVDLNTAQRLPPTGHIIAVAEGGWGPE
jgi:hypothetical protein